jgi:predicted TIM-barrel fold metal-dependent hydrolase
MPAARCLRSSAAWALQAPMRSPTCSRGRRSQTRASTNLRRFYYDTAMSTNIVQMQALKTIAGVSPILFGTDYPFGGDASKHRQGLEKCGLSAEELRGIQRGNAMKLIPKYAA